MKVGDKLRLCPHEYQEDPRNPNPGRWLPCTVTYIHPEHRFYQVEFECPGGKFRESFLFPPKVRSKR